MRKRLLLLTALILSLLFLTSCIGITDTMDFGSGIKLPSILVYIALFGAIIYYLAHRRH